MILLNESKTERYVSVLNRKYLNEYFCVINTNAVYDRSNNGRSSSMTTILLSRYTVLLGREIERSLLQ